MILVEDVTAYKKSGHEIHCTRCKKTAGIVRLVRHLLF